MSLRGRKKKNKKYSTGDKKDTNRKTAAASERSRGESIYGEVIMRRKNVFEKGNYNKNANH